MTKNLLLTATLIILMTSEFSSGATEEKTKNAHACAACRYQHRKCEDNCVLRPYFPANKPEVLNNVNRLYGLTKVTKMLNERETQAEKDDLMQTIIFDATVRSVSPVYGAWGVARDLVNRCDLVEQELQRVKHKLQHAKRFESIVSSSNPHAAEYFSPGSTNPSLYPVGIASNPYAAEYFSSGSTNPSLNPVGVASNPYAAEYFPPGSTIPFQDLTPNINNSNNYYFPRIAVPDGRNEVFSGGAYSGDVAYGSEPLQNPNANANANASAIFHNPSDRRLYPATRNANDNDNENALGYAVTDNQAIGVSTGDFAYGGQVPLGDANANANVFMPYAAEYFSPGSTNPSLNPVGVASNPYAASSSNPYSAEYFSPESSIPLQNLTPNISNNDNYYFPRIAVPDGRNEVSSGGAYTGDDAFGSEPLQNPNSNAIPQTDWSDRRLYPAIGNTDDNNNENALGYAVTDNQAIGVSTGDFAYGRSLGNANAGANVFMQHTDSNDLRFYKATGNANNINNENTIGFAIGADDNQAFHQQGMGVSTTTPNMGQEIQIQDFFSADLSSQEMESFRKKYGFHGQGGDSMSKYDDNPFL